MKAKQKKTNVLELKGIHQGTIQMDYHLMVNYALMTNGGKVLQQCILTNQDSCDWREVSVRIEGPYLQPDTCILDLLPKGQAMHLDTLRILPDVDTLQSLTEAVETTLTLTVSIADEQLPFTLPIRLLPFDQWNGNQAAPQLLTSFITPNHPYVQQLCRMAAEQMQAWTGEAAMNGYQDDDPNRVRQQVAAVYEALRHEAIAYVLPPASFAADGQRIRMADVIRRDKMGTCLDLTLLMAGCLEQLGIHPIIVMMQGHAFVGAWLTEQIYNRAIGYDRERLLKLAANGVGQLVLVETTCVCQSQQCEFEKAAELALNQLRDGEETFVYFIDVKHCRLEQFRPLPQRMEPDGQWIIDPTYQNQPSQQGATQIEHFDIDFDDNSKTQPSRLNVWERKLLDLTMANRLLHIRPGMHCVPLIMLDVAQMAETLLQGDNYRLLSNPTDRRADVFSGGSIDTLFYKEELQAFVQSAAASHAIHAYADDEALDAQLKNITRQAKVNLEESGATSLFLTIGLLHWQDEDEPEGQKTGGWRRRRTRADHVAPIMLLPVQIVQRQGGTGYSIHTTEEPIIFNITIFELLKQRFGIDMSNVLNLAATDGGLNDQAIDNNVALTIRRAFAAIRLALADRQGWNVHEECTLGLYSFLKFVMWNDIHQHAQQLQESPVVKSLIENKLLLNDIPDANARELDLKKKPADLALPIDVDSSQLEAIADAGDGKTFLLYGPPGTGKSQTITNMVANALYQGKRVLFVAQKMAALDVVQNRLDRIGLSPFCLELHSNKATKGHLLQQLASTLQMATSVSQAPDYQQKSEQLFARRQELIGYMESLHRKQPNGMSLYDCISGYMSIEGAEAPVAVHVAQQMDANALDQVASKLELLDAVMRLTGHPADSPMLGLEPYSTSQSSSDALWQKLDQLEDYLQDDSAPYPYSRALADRYPADLEQQYREVELSFFLVRPLKRNRLLKELRLKDPSLQWQDIPAHCMRLGHNQQLRAIIRDIEALAHVAWSDDRQQMLQQIRRWKHNSLQHKNWYHWSSRRKELADLGLESVVEWMIQTHASGASAAQAMRKGVYHQLAMQAIANDAQLGMFNGVLFDETIQRYRTLAADFQQLTRQQLHLLLSQRVARLLAPDQSLQVKEEMTFLKRNIANHGRGVSIRHIVSKLQHVLPELCPCMLMSPLSVAQYVPLEEQRTAFDLVIFDEASQIPTSEAVGAIARGRSVVIVGDPKQMPPTTFFQAQAINEDEAEYDDMESILDDCIALSMPSHCLTWHYRSRHESLISFSNINYYEGRLMTFPSVDDRASHVQFVAVQGTYDKGASRSNRQEAEAIVQQIVDHYSDPANTQSLGVISFSKVQQTLIEDLLAEHLKGHHDLEKRINDGDEPLFIKNLENVQGDERDIILFSVGYGPDKNGNVSMNFGPLNVSGGERRLNVAVSRARCQMKVYSSMHAEQIDLSRTQALGVVGLKNFLYFAEHGQQPAFASQQTGAQTIVGGLPELIATELRARGYQVDTYVGRSSFRVDLAIIDPHHPDRYSLGVLCDGKNYYATPTTRDREVVQPSVLRGLDWQIVRVWSVDWLNNPEAVINQIIVSSAHLQNACFFVSTKKR